MTEFELPMRHDRTRICFTDPAARCSVAAALAFMLVFTPHNALAEISMNSKLPSEPIVRTVLVGTAWDRADAKVEPDADTPSAPHCKLYTVRNTKIPGAGEILFALDTEGRLIAKTGDLIGLANLLRTCLPEDAAAWAQVISRYTDALLPQVIEANDKPRAEDLAAAGATDVAPKMRKTSHGIELDYYVSRPVSRYSRVRAVVPTSGPVKIDEQAIVIR